MGTKVQKQTPRAFYLGLVVVFAALILVAFMPAAGKFQPTVQRSTLTAMPLRFW
jgi:hypothetical protein